MLDTASRAVPLTAWRTRRRSVLGCVSAGLSLLLFAALPLAHGAAPAPAAVIQAAVIQAAVKGPAWGAGAAQAAEFRAPGQQPSCVPHLWQWPTGEPAVVVEAFDPPAKHWLSGHRGVDLELAAGRTLYAPYAGVVAVARVVVDRPVIAIDHEWHGKRLRTTYEPVEPLVAPGERVVAGQPIGTLLPGHRDDGRDAVHWGAMTGPDRYINPLHLLCPARIVLKPISG